jgi:hypothetical protein
MRSAAVDDLVFTDIAVALDEARPDGAVDQLDHAVVL